MEQPASLQAFLTDDVLGSDAAELAYQELFVEEQMLGHATSRFVKEGGVHFSGVRSYAITVANLDAMAVQQRGLPKVQLELLKFWFMIDPLPPNRSYTSVSVRITLRPPGPAHLLEPNLETAEADLEQTSTTDFGSEITRLLRLHVTQSRGQTIRRTEKLPVTTAIDHGIEGFGWTFQAQDGAPLFPHQVITAAVVELPRGTRKLCGLFDTEALITRQMLGMHIERPAAPVNAATPFTIDLTAKPLALPLRIVSSNMRSAAVRAKRSPSLPRSQAGIRA
jgi:hypothetical protein